VVSYFPGDDLFTPFERPRGLPLGNQTSQFFANVYLNPLDQLVNRQLRPPIYARYVDDFVLFGDSKERLAESRRRIEEELYCLRLEMHPGKSLVYPAAGGFTFLGWRIFPEHTRLVRSAGAMAIGRLRVLEARIEKLSIGTLTVDHLNVRSR
jgi:hypothetical protein